MKELPTMADIAEKEEKRKMLGGDVASQRGKGRCCAGCTVCELVTEEEEAVKEEQPPFFSHAAAANHA